MDAVDAQSAGATVERLLSVRELTDRLGAGGGIVQAVTGASSDVFPGETVGVVCVSA